MKSGIRPRSIFWKRSFPCPKSPGCAAPRGDKFMRILRSIPELAEVPGPVFLAIGVFDGVHRGHQAVISTTTLHAAEARGNAVVVTLEKKKKKILRPDKT